MESTGITCSIQLALVMQRIRIEKALVATVESDINKLKSELDIFNSIIKPNAQNPIKKMSRNIELINLQNELTGLSLQLSDLIDKKKELYCKFNFKIGKFERKFDKKLNQVVHCKLIEVVDMINEMKVDDHINEKLSASQVLAEIGSINEFTE